MHHSPPIICCAFQRWMPALLADSVSGRCPVNLLFVCSGNICRSPLAAAFMRHKVALRAKELGLSSLDPEISVKSAGTSASEGHPMAYAMELILDERAIDSTHQSQRLHWEIIGWAELILTMTRPQKVLLAVQIPNLAAPLATLNEYVGLTQTPDIEDPYGTDLNSYRHCAAEIETACDRLLEQLCLSA